MRENLATKPHQGTDVARPSFPGTAFGWREIWGTGSWIEGGSTWGSKGAGRQQEVGADVTLMTTGRGMGLSKG